MANPVPITIITGYLGAGKTTLILRLLEQLPPTYRVAIIKNEFGDVAIDSQLAQTKAVAGVRELLNGCICCNLVGSLKDALESLSLEQHPDRFILETSGSAFPATLAMEVNRIAKETQGYVLDGVINVIDVENWKGYDDISYTAKVQAQYTDLLVLNKWELVDERTLDDCIDHILALDLDIPTARVKSSHGQVDKDLLLGLDSKLARLTRNHDQIISAAQEKPHRHEEDHQSEVQVLSVELASRDTQDGIGLKNLYKLLTEAPKDEVYRIKGVMYLLNLPRSSGSGETSSESAFSSRQRYILNWAFGRWTFTASEDPTPLSDEAPRPIVQMTIITAMYEAQKWAKRIIDRGYVIAVRKPEDCSVSVKIIG